MDREKQIIERIRRALVPRSARSGALGLRLGIGDDAAILRVRAGFEWVVSCDAFLEDVHFQLKSHPPESVGYKALARATSDLAAMGAAPRFFFMTLALPGSSTGTWLERFLRGMARASRESGIALAGGDTSRGSKVAVSITVIGEAEPGRAVTRSGAKPGDLVFVSGTLGRAELGLKLIQRCPARKLRHLPTLLEPHLYPKPRIAVGHWLAQTRLASSMIDISDGLSTDLNRLCEASGVGAWIFADRVPVVTIPRGISSRRFDPLAMALHGGDDYELLFTVPAQRERELSASPKAIWLSRIGEITMTKGVIVQDLSARRRRLFPGGWDPFKGQPRRQR